MNTAALRQKLHEFIDQIEEKKAKAIYTLFEEEINQTGNLSIRKYNDELAEAETDYRNGKYTPPGRNGKEGNKMVKKFTLFCGQSDQNLISGLFLNL